jgi:ATP-dependent HslUV protease subunit HslV
MIFLVVAYCTAAARALIDIPELSAEDVARKAMNIASDMCVYTNKEFMVEVMDTKDGQEEEAEPKKKED